MDQQLESYSVELRTGSIPANASILDWLSESEYTPADSKLLAHAHDGVIWGQYVDGELTLSHTSPALSDLTLQQARFFTPERELYVWCHNGRWHYRSIVDKPEETSTCEAYDEHQILWGNYFHASENGFTELEEGTQGLNHAVPLVVTAQHDQLKGRIALRIRHYLGEYKYSDKNGASPVSPGVNYIAYSRLVTIERVQAEEMNNE